MKRILLGIVVVLTASQAWAQTSTLTNAQLLALKAVIQADSTLNGKPDNNDGNAEIADALDVDASPDFWIWRTAVSEAEYTQTTSVDGTTFNWTGSGFIGRTAGELTAWRELFGMTGSINPSLSNVRQAIADILSGAVAPAPANRTHMLTISRQKASRAEKALAVGTGSTASPATFGFREGKLTGDEVQAARHAQ